MGADVEVRRLLTCAPFRPPPSPSLSPPSPSLQAGRPPREPGAQRPRPGDSERGGAPKPRAGSAAAPAGSGVPGPLCVQSGGGVAGSPRPRGPRPFPRGGARARRLPHPCSAARGRSLLPTPPGPALGSYRKGITIPSPPTRHLALSPPPPVTSSSSPVGPSASPHSPPQFVHFRPPSASPCRSAASGVLFFPPFG